MSVGDAERPCVACAAHRDEIAFLRGQLVRLQEQLGPAPRAETDTGQTALAPGTTVIGPGGVILSVPRGSEAEAAPLIGEQGEAMILVDGEQVPLEEFNRWKRGIDQAMAGKPIESP